MHAEDVDMASAVSGRYDKVLQLMGDAWDDIDSETEFLVPEDVLGVNWLQ